MQHEVLTASGIEKATRREEISHPVLNILEQNSDELKRIGGVYTGINDAAKRQRFLVRNYTPIANALERLDEFSLTPLELIAIWSKTTEVDCQGYAFAGILASTYATRGIPGPEWKTFPSYYFKHEKLPPRTVANTQYLNFVVNGLRFIDNSLQAIDTYCYGTKDGPDLLVSLGKKIASGDEEAKRQYLELAAYKKAHSTPLLDRIGENFGNGMLPLTLSLSQAIG